MTEHHDPCGPGTEVWRASDLAIAAYRRGDEANAREMLAIVRCLLTHHGRASEIPAWTKFIEVMAGNSELSEFYHNLRTRGVQASEA